MDEDDNGNDLGVGDNEKVCRGGEFSDNNESQMDDRRFLFLFQSSNRSACFLLI